MHISKLSLRYKTYHYRFGVSEHLKPLWISNINDPMPRVSDFIFPSTKLEKPLSDGGMSSVLRRLKADVTVHGFRSSFRDYIAEETGFSYRVAEYALAHQLNDETKRAYARGDLLQKRFEVMNHWANYLSNHHG